MSPRSDCVRHKFPLRATYSRQVLPHVVGSPHLRVLCLIRLPIGIRRTFPFTVLLRLPDRLSMLTLRFQHSPVSRFLLRASIAVYPTPALPTGRSLWGLPSSLTYLFLHATACGLRRTFTSKPITDALVLPSAIVKTLGVRENLISKLYQHFRVRDHPYGLQDSLSTLHLFCSPTSLSTPPQAQDSIRVGG